MPVCLPASLPACAACLCCVEMCCCALVARVYIYCLDWATIIFYRLPVVLFDMNVIVVFIRLVDSRFDVAEYRYLLCSFSVFVIFGENMRYWRLLPSYLPAWLPACVCSPSVWCCRLSRTCGNGLVLIERTVTFFL